MGVHVCVHTYDKDVHPYVTANVCGLFKEAREEFESLRAGNAGICELPDIGARIQTLVLVMDRSSF